MHGNVQKPTWWGRQTERPNRRAMKKLLRIPATIEVLECKLVLHRTALLVTSPNTTAHSVSCKYWTTTQGTDWPFTGQQLSCNWSSILGPRLCERETIYSRHPTLSLVVHTICINHTLQLTCLRWEIELLDFNIVRMLRIMSEPLGRMKPLRRKATRKVIKSSEGKLAELQSRPVPPLQPYAGVIHH